MSYLNHVYYSRINHLGETLQERAQNSAMRSFEKWLASSPHTIRHLSVERGLYFPGIIVSNKDKEYSKIMLLNVANDIPLKVGDILNWQQQDGIVEKWILLSEEKKVNGGHRVFEIIRCNYYLKWIDMNGHLQASWTYVVSSVDSKIKGNFRTWNNLITPQPNKYAEIIMPRRVIDRSTNFIIEEESWKVMEYDHTSVPGIIYLSLTENKINLQYDDLNNEIADTDRRAEYKLILPPTIQRYTVGSVIEPIFTIMKNGIPFDTKYQLVSCDKTIAKYENEQLKAAAEGEVDLQVKLLGCDDIEPTELLIHIIVDDTPTEFSCYIDGSDKIKLDREEKYVLINTENTTLSNIIFTIDKPELAKIVSTDLTDNTCTIHANAKNKLDVFTLTATVPVNGKSEDEYPSYSKQIKVVPLW